MVILFAIVMGAFWIVLGYFMAKAEYEYEMIAVEARKTISEIMLSQKN